MFRVGEVPLYMDQYTWSSVKCCTGTVTRSSRLGTWTRSNLSKVTSPGRICVQVQALVLAEHPYHTESVCNVVFSNDKG